MRVLVTGAAGFVGTWLIPRLLAEGHDVWAALGPGMEGADLPDRVKSIEADLTDADSATRLADLGADGVFHLAGVSSGAESLADAGRAYDVNTTGTARLAESLGRVVEPARPVRMLLISTGLVYGTTTRPSVEADPIQPRGPYAASKAAAEIAGLDVMRRTGLEVVIARPFPHTGPGQDDRFVVPSFARRIQEAEGLGAAAIAVGNLEPVRDFLHVADVVDAYVRLMDRGRPGEVYNVASGHGTSIQELFRMICSVAGSRVIGEVDPALVRAGDTMYSVGDAQKLTGETGWRPTRSLEETIREVVDAQKN